MPPPGGRELGQAFVLRRNDEPREALHHVANFNLINRGRLATPEALSIAQTTAPTAGVAKGAQQGA